MTDERWRRAAELFHAALERPPADRAAFLADACAANLDLLAEVESLLAAHCEADGFLERPAAAERPDLALDPAFARGQVVGRYRIESQIGHGGMGVVYRAHDLRLDRDVALKIVSPALAAEPTARARLEREAQAAAALAHPGVAQVYALEDIDDQTVLVSEFIVGTTLRNEIAAGVLSERRTVTTVMAVVEALAAAHAAGLVHRDLKPDNVMRTTAGRIKILDFGVVRLAPAAAGPQHPRLTGTGHVLGTPGYMSPEQLEGRDVDARTDIYAVGVLLAELLTGRRPPAAGGWPTGISPVRTEVAAVIARCLAHDPDDRYPSAAQLLADLRALSSSSSSASSSSADSALADQPAARSGSTENAEVRTAAWWWKFHQVVIVGAYVLAVIASWSARSMSANTLADICMLGATITSTAGTTLRLHLWFVHDTDRATFPAMADEHLRRLRINDWVLAGILGVAGYLVVGSHVPLAATLVGGAAALVTTSAVVEPATTRALIAAIEELKKK